MVEASLSPSRKSGNGRLLAAWLLSTAVCATADDACATTPHPTPEQVLSTVGMTGDDAKRLMAGEIVPYSAAEPTDTSIASGVAMYVSAAPSRLTDLIQGDALLAGDPDVLAFGRISPNAGVAAFKRFAYTAKQKDEIRSLLRVKPGSEFNLSAQEIEDLRRAAKGLDANRANAAAEALSRQYRKILSQRTRAYLKAGWYGIAPYARGGGRVTDAGAELRIFTVKNKLLELFDPALREALLRRSGSLPPATINHFLWLNRRVEKRPTAILFQRLTRKLDGASVVVQNEFYAAHSFNVGQLVIGCVPYQGGTLVVYTHRSSSDQVSGLGQSLKHSIGRGMLKEEMVRRLRRLRKLLK